MPYNNIILEEQTTTSTINDFIGKPPGFLLRSGISIIGLVTMVIITLAAIIKYPDKITGRGVLTSEIPPIELKSPSNGIIEQIYVKDGDTLLKGDPILYIRNTAEEKDIEILTQYLKHFEESLSMEQLLQISLPENLQLGTLQGDYAALVLKLNELKAIFQQRGNAAQIQHLGEEVRNLQKLNKALKEETAIYEQELQLAKIAYKRAKLLAEDGIISDQEKEKTQSQLLQYQRQQKSMAKNIIQNNIRIKQLQLQQLQLTEERQKTLDSYLFAIKETVSRLQSAARHWKDSYIVTASADGIFHFQTTIVRSQKLTTDQLLGYVLSLQAIKEKYIKAITPAIGIGKINERDKVLIKFDSYPYKEYGILVSQVGQILPYPIQDKEGNSFYEIKIPLTPTIETNYGSQIPFKPNAGLQAEIITEEKTILGRIFNQFLDLINNI